MKHIRKKGEKQTDEKIQMLHAFNISLCDGAWLKCRIHGTFSELEDR